MLSITPRARPATTAPSRLSKPPSIAAAVAEKKMASIIAGATLPRSDPSMVPPTAPTAAASPHDTLTPCPALTPASRRTPTHAPSRPARSWGGRCRGRRSRARARAGCRSLRSTVRRTGTGGSVPSVPEVRLADGVVVEHRLRVAAGHDRPGLEQIGTVGDLHRQVGVLLHEQDRGAVLLVQS